VFNTVQQGYTYRNRPVFKPPFAGLGDAQQYFPCQADTECGEGLVCCEDPQGLGLKWCLGFAECEQWKKKHASAAVDEKWTYGAAGLALGAALVFALTRKGKKR
jgi:hypothetical protein